MTLVLYDDAVARAFEPFAAARPLGEHRSGALLIRERWELVLDTKAHAFAGAPWLDGFVEFDAPPALSRTSSIIAGAWVVNTRALPFLGSVPTSSANVVYIDERVAAVALRASIDVAQLQSGTLTLEEIANEQKLQSSVEIDGVWLDAIWDHITHLTPLLLSDVPELAKRLSCAELQPSDRVPVTGSHKVWIEDGANVEPFSVFDTTAGPVLLRRGSHVQAFTRVTGPCYVGIGSSLVGDRIANASIGDTCRVRGELSSSIFFGYANKGHDGFVGHSVIGRWANLGAGTITSNLKNTYGKVALWTPQGVQATPLQFLGTMFGDHVKTGIGLRLTTGCVLGIGANLFDRMPPKMVTPFSWGAAHGAEYATCTEDKFLEAAARMMQRRSITLDDEQRGFLRQVYARAVNKLDKAEH